ncbi:MAG: FHA domain-containing protein [Lysobacteraceae bacterium]|nr:MAG: FHA domain-containing protein [Xanthomonadaceae bacterium]
MAMKLVFPGGEHAPLLLDSGTCRVGSAPDGDVVLAGEGVAPLHCELSVGPQGVQLRVLPGMGVQVNERPVDGLIALRADDRLDIGGVRVRLVALAAAGDGAAPVGGDIGATMVRPVVPKFVLRGLSGEHFGKHVPLHASMTLGRAEDAGLRLAQDGISRLHARLTPAGDDVLVEDLGSANGTWLNGRRILREQARHGDEIRFDTQRFQLLVPGQPLAANAGAPRSQARHAGGGRVLVLAVLAAIAVAVYLVLR